MSLVKHILNPWLKFTEKPFMARASVAQIRRSFEWKARLFFRAPRGAAFGITQLSDAGRNVEAVTIAGQQSGPLILYFHGGGYFFGSPRTHRSMLAWLSEFSGLPVTLPQYRLAPEHPFPAAIEDALTAYRAVMDHPGGVVLGGDSAGGGLALSLLGEITRTGLPQPVASFAFSPVTDLSFSGESFTRNADTEVELPAARAAEFTQYYLGGADPRDPRASPLYADFSGAGPVWLAAGDREILLDDTRRMAARLQDQRVEVTCVIEENLPHVWPIFKGLLPEAGRTLRDLAAWITAHSPR